jgi:hypothetical protein
MLGPAQLQLPGLREWASEVNAGKFTVLSVGCGQLLPARIPGPQAGKRRSKRLPPCTGLCFATILRRTRTRAHAHRSAITTAPKPVNTRHLVAD